MLCLGLDTTGAYCSVSLVDSISIRAHISEKINRGHAERLAPMVAEVFNDAGVSASDVSRVAVCTGPGSFTGLRVALAFAKGFALPRDVPVIGINALQVASEATDPEHEKYVVAIQDIRRGQVMCASYLRGEELTPPTAMSLEEAKDLAADMKAEFIEDRIADTRILAWLAMDANPEHSPAIPLYSRAPDAKLPGGKTP